MVTLPVELTDEQYTRFKAAMAKMQEVETVDDAQLIAQMKREAAAITYAAEKGQLIDNWTF